MTVIRNVRPLSCAVFALGLAHALALGLTRAPAAHGTVLFERGDALIEFSGSLRELILYTEQTSQTEFEGEISRSLRRFSTACIRAEEFAGCPAFSVLGDRPAWQANTRARMRLDLSATAWLSAVVVYDHIIAVGVLNTLESQLGGDLAPNTFLGAESEIIDRGSFAWQHGLYRGYVQVETEYAEIVVGRQRVAWGVGRLWNPIDRFNAIPPLAIEAGESNGIDGIDARWMIDGFSYLEAVYAPGDNRDEARYGLRLHGVLFDTDLSLMGGVFAKAPTIGFDLSRNLGDAALHIEVVYTDPDLEVWRLDAPGPAPPRAYWQVVAAFEMNFALGTGLYFLAEHLYNGNALGFGVPPAGSFLSFFEATDVPPPGLPPGLVKGPYATAGSVDVFGGSQVVSGATHQTAIQLGYDLTPEIRANLLTLYDWNGTSAAFFPSLSYSGIASVELSLGGQIFAGQERSEFGPRSNLVFGRAEWFF